eukprot:136111-Chlamydomonas_euryale.AAC.2
MRRDDGLTIGCGGGDGERSPRTAAATCAPPKTPPPTGRMVAEEARARSGVASVGLAPRRALPEAAASGPARGGGRDAG